MANVIDYERYKSRYKANGKKTSSGRKSVDCGDRVARELRNVKNSNDLKKVFSDNGFKDNYSHLNYGMRRMVVSNLLRGALRNGEEANVLGVKWSERRKTA